jgi:polyphenol oxidase
MIRREHAGVVYDVFASFEGQPGSGGPSVMHAVLTRHGGQSKPPYATLNLGHLVGDDPADVEANHARVYAALGLRREQVVTARQVHGDHVARVTLADGGSIIPATDALISDTPGLGLLLRYADCVPVLFYDPVRRAVGLAHAGWQGTLVGIAGKTALAMQETFGCRPTDLRAGIGPSIGPCCCELGPEVLAKFRAVYSNIGEFLAPTGKQGNHAGLPLRDQDGRGGSPCLPSDAPTADGRARLDLWRLNAWQLAQAGVTQVEVAGACTVCQRQDYFSHRGEGGLTGRFGALIAIQEYGNGGC